MLLAWLEYHRATLAMKCDGLSDEQLRSRAVPPSTLSLLGLVRHMADVERTWFRGSLRGEVVPPLLGPTRTPTATSTTSTMPMWPPTSRPWRAECDVARAIVEATPSLDELERREGGLADRCRCGGS